MKIIAKAIEDGEDEGWVNLSGVGSRILGAKPDFDARSYDCPNLSTLAGRSGGFEVPQGPRAPSTSAARRRSARPRPGPGARLTAGRPLSIFTRPWGRRVIAPARARVTRCRHFFVEK